nr:putative small nuclear ribonucleoprotein G [Cryptomonas curvata]
MHLPRKNGSKIELLLNKKILVNLRMEEKIEGILLGFDQFLNLVLNDSVLLIKNEKKDTGMILIRGSNINSIEQ